MPENTPPADDTPLPATPRIRITGPGDLAQALPYLLGHTGLADDVVLLATRGRRTVLTLRLDLAALAAGVLWSATVAEALTAAQADHVHVIAYPVGPVTDATLATLHTDLVIAAAARPKPLDIAHVVTVADGTWWAHDLHAAAPAGPGTPIVANPTLTLGLTVGYGAPAPSRAHAVSVLDRHPDPVLAHVEALIAGIGPRETTTRTQAAQTALARRIDRSLDWSLPEAADVLDALTDRHTRDLLVVQSHHQHAWWTWSTLLPYAPRRWRAPVATMVAFAAHQRGNGLLAGAAVDQALDADPSYALAQMFAQVLKLGLTPAQVRDDLLAPAAAELADGRP
jgi:hypothetical protein